jgi:hypothetical protein
MTSEIITKAAPDTVSHRLAEFMAGKATWRAPICCGTTKLNRPTRNGIATKKIMMVAWEVRI